MYFFFVFLCVSSSINSVSSAHCTQRRSWETVRFMQQNVCEVCRSKVIEVIQIICRWKCIFTWQHFALYFPCPHVLATDNSTLAYSVATWLSTSRHRHEEMMKIIFHRSTANAHKIGRPSLVLPKTCGHFRKLENSAATQNLIVPLRRLHCSHAAFSLPKHGVAGRLWLVRSVRYRKRRWINFDKTWMESRDSFDSHVAPSKP